MKASRRKIGQGMVEFALILPVLLMIILGIIEFGRLMFIYSAVTSASRDASRYGASIGPGPNGRPRYRECEAIRGAALSIGSVVGVDPGDVYITYDEGPLTGATPLNCPDDVELGDRIIVEVRGDYNPLPAAPLVGLLAFEFTSISRRTIIKDAPIQQAGTALGALATDTPSPFPTIDLTTTATPSASPTITNTPGVATATPTYTPTPIPPKPPLYAGINYTPFGNKCNDIILSWSPNLDWATYPGGPPTIYQTYKNGFFSSSISPSDPANTVWVTGDQINTNSLINYDIVAIFPGPLRSKVLSKSYMCEDGNMIDISSNPSVKVVIVVRSVDYLTLKKLLHTRFEAIAWDDTVGTSNGDGIAQVYFQLIGPSGIVYINTIETVKRYCVFSGNSQCEMWNDTALVPFLSAPDGDYVLKARALSSSGVFTPWTNRYFTLLKFLTPTPTATATPTPTPTT